MDYEEGGVLRSVFRGFVCISLTTLLGLHMYGYLWGPSAEGFDGDFTDIKYVVMQLTRGLSEVNRKHEHLKTEMDRIATALPSITATAGATGGRGRDNAHSCVRGTRLGVEPYEYDRQITDFALETAGARVVDTGDTVEHLLYESPVGYALHLLASWMCRGHECLNARAMIRPGTLPGECWAFRGTKGEATIRLLGTVHVTGISLEHIPSHISPTKDITSAPRVFQIEGLEHRNDLYPHDFGTFEYSKHGRPIQYFEVHHPTTKGYNLIRIRIISNWGHPVYTCVYRVRVHGDLVGGQPVPSEEDMRIDNE